MNVPSRGDGNWSWRCPPGALTDELARKLAELSEVTDRDHVPAPERDPEPEEFEQEFEQDVEETRAGESDAQAASAHTDAKL
jgi:predicted transcriptional regulator